MIGGEDIIGAAGPGKGRLPVRRDLGKGRGAGGPRGRHRPVLLATVSALTMMLNAGAVRAQATNVDGGAEITVPGDHDSPWSLGGNLRVGYTGTGTLRIEAGATVSNTIGYIGYGSGSNGAVTVSGDGSTWQNSGELNVGYSGEGTLIIEDGGTVSNTLGHIGYIGGSSGTVTVSGEGASWQNSGYLYVGESGEGTLTIEDGGTVSNTFGYIGSEANSVGTVTVSGNGSTWENSNNILVGNKGEGTLIIEDGGSVTSWLTYIGSEANSVGTVTVTGDGSTWQNDNNLYVGNKGIGALTVENGGTVSALAVVLGSALGGTGTLTLAGTEGARGVLVAERLSRGSGDATVTFDGGLLRATTDQADFLSGFAPGDDVTVADGGAFIDSNTFDIGIEAALGGTGGLTKLGAGTLTLTGLNSYAGGTAINGGTLVVATNARLGDAAGGLSFDGGTLRTTASFTIPRTTTLGPGGGTFETEAGTTLTHAGIISGPGQLTKDGAGTLKLTGLNSYTGGTLVLGGELVVDTDSLPGDVTVDSGAFLTFEQDTDGTYTGVISGAGGVRVNGDGTLTFTALQAYDGEIEIAGVLQAAAESLRGNVSIAAGGALVLNQAADGSYAGDIGGSGDLVKTGAGTAILAGNLAHGGQTIVNAGTLRINGTLAGLATVGAGAVLGGSGSFLGGIDNHGTLAPGNSIGTMAVTGPLTFNAGSVYEVEVDAAGQSDRIEVDGPATLAGTVRVLPAPGDYAAQTDYTILTADSLSGSFDAVTSASAFLDPSLLYGATDVTLRLTRNAVAFADVARTPNQRAVAGALDAGSAGAAGDYATLLGAVAGLSAAEARAAFDRLGGAGLAAVPTVQLLDQARFDGALQAAADPAAGTGLWATAYGTGGTVDGDGNAAGFDHRGGGVVAGLGWRVGAEATLGLALGYGRSRLDHGAGEDGTVDTVRAGLYGAWQPAGGRLVLDGALGAGRSDYESERRLAFGALARRAEGEADGHEISARLGAGYRLDHGAWQVTPRASLAYVRLHRDGFAETGAGAAGLEVGAETVESVQGRLGLAVARPFATAAGLAVTPAAALTWRHEFGDTERVVDAAFAGAPDIGFRVAGADAARDTAELALGVSATTGGGTTWQLGYGASLGGGEAAHALRAGLRLSW